MLQEALEIEIVTFTNTFCKKLIKDLLKDVIILERALEYQYC